MNIKNFVRHVLIRLYNGRVVTAKSWNVRRAEASTHEEWNLRLDSRSHTPVEGGYTGELVLQMELRVPFSEIGITEEGQLFASEPPALYGEFIEPGAGSGDVSLASDPEVAPSEGVRLPHPVAPEGQPSDTESTLNEAVEMAWVIIANAYEGDWSKAPAEWREAAERWRDESYVGSIMSVHGPGTDIQGHAFHLIRWIDKQSVLRFRSDVPWPSIERLREWSNGPEPGRGVNDAGYVCVCGHWTHEHYHGHGACDECACRGARMPLIRREPADDAPTADHEHVYVRTCWCGESEDDAGTES